MRVRDELLMMIGRKSNQPQSCPLSLRRRHANFLVGVVEDQDERSNQGEKDQQKETGSKTEIIEESFHQLQAILTASVGGSLLDLKLDDSGPTGRLSPCLSGKCRAPAVGNRQKC